MKAEIYISEICGLCYGSNNAINKTKDTLDTHNNVVLYKEILHNQNVMDQLKSRGALLKNNLKEITCRDYVIIRAHGEPYSTFKYFDDNHIKYLDCTCPNVKAINFLVKEKDKLGYKIIIIGKHGFDGKPMHPEVLGTAGWCSSPLFIEDESEIHSIDLSFDKYFLVVQTTFSKDKALFFIDKIEKIMKQNNKTFEYRNTICNAQKNINNASIELAKKVDIMIVIGGKKSSNSLGLFNKVKEICLSFFIDNPSCVLDLINDKKISAGQKIGITAGASTLKEDIIQVEKLLKENLN